MKRILQVVIICITLVIIFLLFSTQVRQLSLFDGEIISTDSNKIQVHFIHWIDFPEDIFKTFEQENPNIQVIYENLNESDYSDLIRARLVSNNNVDLFGIKPNDYTDFITIGYLEDLTYKKYISKIKPEVNENIKGMIFNHRQYAISYNLCSYAVWYNKSIFNRNNIKVPTTYDNFIEVCQQLIDNGINPIVMGARDDKTMRVVYLLSDPFANASLKLQEDLQNANISWKDETVMDAFNKVEYLISNGYIMKKSIYLTYQQAFQEFVKGSAAMTIMSSNSISLGQVEFDQQAGEFGVFSLPLNQDNSIITNPVENGNELIGIYSKSSNKDEANRFMEFILRNDIVKEYMKYKKVMMPLMEIGNQDLEYSKEWLLLSNHPKKPVTTYFMDYRLEKEFDSLTKQLMIGNITAEEMANALELLQKQINEEDILKFE